MKKYAVFSLLLAVLFSRILFTQPTKQIIGDGGDNYEFYGYMYVAHDNIAHGKYPFTHSTLMRYPGGFDFSYGYDGAFATSTGALLSFIVPLPLAFNLTIVAILWFNLFLSFYFFRKIAHLVKHSPGQNLQYFIAGMLFGWSPFVFARLNGHLNLAVLGGLPILLYFLIKFFRSIWHEQKISFADYLAVGLGFLTVAVGSLQYIVLTVECGIVFLLFALVVMRKPAFVWIRRFIKLLTPRKFLIIVAAAFLTIAGFLLFYYGYAWAILTHNFSTQGVSYADSLYFPSWIDLIVPNSFLGSWWAYLSSSPAEIERVSSFGMVPLLLFIAFVLRLKNKKLIVSIAALIGFFIIVTLSPFHLPLVPEPGRVVVFALLAMTALWTIYEVKINKKILVLILVLLIAEHAFYLIRISPQMPWKAAQVVSSTQGSAVLDVPLSPLSFTGALPYLWQKNILDGSFHYPAKNALADRTLTDPQIENFVCDKNRVDKFSRSDIDMLYAKLKKMNISTVVLFKQGIGQTWWYPECANVRDWWNYLNPIKAIPSLGGLPSLQRFEFGRDSAISSPMAFDQSGNLEFTTISLWPPQINDFTIETANGKKITPNWHMAQNNKDLEADFNPPLAIPVATNSSIRLFSNKTVDSNTYVGAYYRYKPAQTTALVKRPYLQLIWGDDSIEVYSIVNN
jgi:hypothetical protein